ncbi:MAG: PIG-L family deacetylase [Candidatus Lokiarchaeota archaeon]|nr:PIG-L family deacetylase [Candidatus Lokiarchaeota archaeon]
MKKPTALIICPHPDDGDIMCGEFCAQSVNAGWNVHELLMTTDEYGTTRNDFKGKRIKAIRKAEMIRASRCYGVDNNGNALLQLHWANYIDGFAPFTIKSVERLQMFIQKINPDVILGPDPFVHHDAHVDHLATGRNYYYALKWMDPKKRPKLMLFFQSLMPNFFIPILNPKTVFCARIAHRSQWTERTVKIYGNIQRFLYPFRLITVAGGRKSEGFRKVTFNYSNHYPQGFAKFVFRLFKDRPIGYKEGHFIPTPGQLQLKLEPEGEIE